MELEDEKVIQKMTFSKKMGVKNNLFRGGLLVICYEKKCIQNKFIQSSFSKIKK